MRARLFTGYLVLILISIMITGFITLKFTEQNYMDMTEERLVENAKVIKEYIISYADERALEDFAVGFSRQFGIRLTIIAPDGSVTLDTSKDASTMEKHTNRPEIASARRGEVGKNIRYSDTLDTNMMYVAIPLQEENEVLRLAVPLDTVQSKIRHQWRIIILALLVALGIAVYQGNHFSAGVTKPVLEMVDLSHRIARGEFGRMAEGQYRDEMEELVYAFNSMASRLKQSIGELKANSLKLEAILSSISDGVIAVDSYMRIILINPTAKRLFRLEENVLGEYFLEVFHFDQFYIMLQKIMNKKETSTMELILNQGDEKILRVNGAPILEESNFLGAVILVQDITELRKLEQVRTDFVANVSHELKTPLTSIKGFVETLRGGAIENKETAVKFLDIIQIEADRLSRLINDILSLSELESSRNSLLADKINIAAIARDTLDMMKAYADTKNITLENSVLQDEVWIHGSADRIKQMLINLVDNAIKYTPTGGKVTVMLEDLKDTVICRVRDTGIGIAEEHIPRLFERFYRVDKGRSRSQGGTGLGLAIVKHIVLSMKGRIEVKSQVGKGSEFSIFIPKA
jgi:two-component system phosphate regulon sensor histidine kinase PhoR